MKKRISALLHPPVRTIVIADLIAAPFVIFTLNMLEAIHPLSFASYFISSYALLVTAVNLKRVVRRIKELSTGDELAAVRKVKSFMRRYKYTRLYLESFEFRAEVGLYMSLVINMFYAVFKGITGVIYDSAWLWSMGIYYFFLGAIRFYLMRGVRRKLGSKSEQEIKLHEFRTYRLCGALMMVLNLAVAGMAIQMIWQNKANEYSRVTVIISAAFTFYCFILSIYNAVSFRKRNNVILSAAKDLALIGALMSMLSLQTSMLHTFGAADEGRFRMIMNSVTAGIVIISVLSIASYMIINGTKKISQLQDQMGGQLK